MQCLDSYGVFIVVILLALICCNYIIEMYSFTTFGLFLKKRNQFVKCSTMNQLYAGGELAVSVE
jgi:hypothetical protein